MKKKINLKKWILNYVIFGVVPYILLALFFETLDSFTVRDIFYDLFLNPKGFLEKRNHRLALFRILVDYSILVF